MNPSNQMQLPLPGCGDDGMELMREARAWAAVNYDEFAWFKRQALDDSRAGYASANCLLQMMRRKFRVKVPNAYAACLARIAKEQDDRIRFRHQRSKVDGFTPAVL